MSCLVGSIHQLIKTDKVLAIYKQEPLCWNNLVQRYRYSMISVFGSSKLYLSFPLLPLISRLRGYYEFDDTWWKCWKSGSIDCINIALKSHLQWWRHYDAILLFVLLAMGQNVFKFVLVCNFIEKAIIMNFMEDWEMGIIYVPTELDTSINSKDLLSHKNHWKHIHTNTYTRAQSKIEIETYTLPIFRVE